MGKTETAVFGGGCFWCTEAIYQQIKGVLEVEPGYAGGKLDNPTYIQVGSGQTGHAEVIKIEFDPTKVSYEQLLDVFFHIHNPTTLNFQGNDTGPQYRSLVLTTSEKQASATKKMIIQLTKSGEFERPIVTIIEPLIKFWPAEDYHQNYYRDNQNNPYCKLVINPKLKHFRERYVKLIDPNESPSST